MNLNISIPIIRFAHVMLIVAIAVVSCGGGSATYPNTPEGVTRKLFDSLQENDANKYLDSITPADRQQPGYFFYRQLIQGLFGGLGLGQVEASKLRISFADMTIEEISNDGTMARVQVTGKLRDLNLALEQDFSTIVITANLDGAWLVSLYGNTSQALSTAPTTSSPENALDIEGTWFVSPLYLEIGPNPSHEGYNYLHLDLDVSNVSHSAQQDLPNFAVELEDERGYKYPAQVGYYSTSARHVIPPGLVDFGYASADIPSNTENLTITLLYYTSSYEIPVSMSGLDKGPGSSYSKLFHPDVSSVLDYAPETKSIGQTAQAAEVAEVTLESTEYNSDTRLLKVVIRVKNEYGYELRWEDSIRAEVFSDVGYSVAPWLNPNEVIPPGSEESWEYSISLGDLRVRSLNDVALITWIERNGLDPLSQSEPIVYTVHRFTLQ